MENSAFGFITMENGVTTILDWILNSLDVGEAQTTLLRYRGESRHES